MSLPQDRLDNGKTLKRKLPPAFPFLINAHSSAICPLFFILPYPALQYCALFGSIVARLIIFLPFKHLELPSTSLLTQHVSTGPVIMLAVILATTAVFSTLVYGQNMEAAK